MKWLAHFVGLVFVRANEMEAMKCANRKGKKSQRTRDVRIFTLRVKEKNY